MRPEGGERHEAPGGWEGSRLPPLMVAALLLPSTLDALRVAFGVPFMSLLAVSGCAAIWLVRGAIRGHLDLRYNSTCVWLVLMGAAAFLSVTSPFGNPLSKLYRAASFCYTRLFMVFLVMNVVRSLAQVRQAIGLLVGIGTLSAGVALWQFWMYMETGVNYGFAQGEEMFRITHTGTYLRATALTSHPNEIGIILAVTSIWGLFLGLFGEGIRPWGRLLRGGSFLLMAAGLIVTFSRSALAAFVVSALGLCLIAPLVYRPFWRRGGAALFGLLGGGGLALVSLAELSPILGETGGEDVLWRIELNQTGLRAMLENPFTGVGVDAFTSYDNPYELAVHNLLIQVGAETGLLGLLVFVALIGSLLARLALALWQSPAGPARTVLLALSLGYVAKLLSHLSNPILTDLFFWLYVGLAEGGIMAAQGAARDPGPPARSG